MAKVVKYTESDFDQISEFFTAELDINIIEDLKEIKKNNKFIRRKSPIRLKYKISNWSKSREDLDNLSDTEIVSKSITSNLNKLTDDNFDLIYTEIKNIIDKYTQIDLKLIIDIIFEKSLEESFYSKVYSKLIINIIDDTDKNIKNYLLDKLESYFNNLHKLQINLIGADIDYDELCKINQNKSSIIGFIELVSNLFNDNYFPYDSIKDFYVKSIDNISSEEENIDMLISICIGIMSNSGLKLKTDYKEDFNSLFLSKMNNLIENKLVVIPKYKFKILDTLDLIKNNWVL
tara:strand:+ start:194 stop:1063 length:870 start_codon:yes stop_codon:yes gene_type:complete